MPGNLPVILQSSCMNGLFFFFSISIFLLLPPAPHSSKQVFDLSHESGFMFHNNSYVEKTGFKPAYKKQLYYAIMNKAGKQILQKVSLKFEEVDDECIGEKIIYFRIPGNYDPDIPLLASTLLNERSVLKNASYTKKKFMDVKDRIDIQFLNENYTLSLKKNKQPNDSLDLSLVYNNNSQFLNRTVLDEEYPPKLIFAGDLSGDEGIDLILQVTEKQAIYWILLISTAKPTGKPALKEKASCFYTAVPC